MRTIQKPSVGEYPEYSEIYMGLMDDDGRVLEHLWSNFLEIKEFVFSIPEEKLVYRYAKDKWTIKEILVHLIDDERIFAYRALRYARNDNTPLHGFDQDDYAKYSHANQRTLKSIFEEYETVRKSTISLFLNLPDDSFMRKGSGVDYDGSVINERTVRGLAYHIAGHELRHFNIIKERYFN
ncbi:DinB family protein [Flagellimonas hymeniacidonis]|uniref:DinB family protein n=1 Tax=Flagellimonas hymeniacidonis TaxID=2603628 RepID=A0A5C8V7R6_9FLAO|nr:DinB family protein [Flagellimonas hymeniacidonis]TXN37752.1 DinB family protein [Flagellimonas hymeniacidonis]